MCINRVRARVNPVVFTRLLAQGCRCVCLFGRRPRERYTLSKSIIIYVNIHTCIHNWIVSKGNGPHLLTYSLACLLRDADACVCLDEYPVSEQTSKISILIYVYTHTCVNLYIGFNPYKGDYPHWLTYSVVCLFGDADACVYLDDDPVDAHTIHISIWIYVCTHTCLKLNILKGIVFTY